MSIAEDKIIQQSLVELILEGMLERIAKREEFDDETVQKLKELLSAGDLKKANKVKEALKAKQS